VAGDSVAGITASVGEAIASVGDTVAGIAVGWDSVWVGAAGSGVVSVGAPPQAARTKVNKIRLAINFAFMLYPFQVDKISFTVLISSMDVQIVCFLTCVFFYKHGKRVQGKV
jgi:hypothetical protein